MLLFPQLCASPSGRTVLLAVACSVLAERQLLRPASGLHRQGAPLRLSYAATFVIARVQRRNHPSDSMSHARRCRALGTIHFAAGPDVDNLISGERLSESDFADDLSRLTCLRLLPVLLSVHDAGRG